MSDIVKAGDFTVIEDVEVKEKEEGVLDGMKAPEIKGDPAKIKVNWRAVKRKMHPKIETVIGDILTVENVRKVIGYYGEFYKYINFYEADPEKTGIHTAGVNVSRHGVNFFYSKEFIDKLSFGEMVFLLLHELDHILLRHQKRDAFYKFQHGKMNIVQDQIINEGIIDYYMNRLNQVGEQNKKNEKYITALHGDVKPLRMPLEYQDEHIAECVYVWLRDEIENKTVYDICMEIKDEMEHRQGLNSKGEYDFKFYNRHLNDVNLQEPMDKNYPDCHVIDTKRMRPFIDTKHIMKSIEEKKVQYEVNLKLGVTDDNYFEFYCRFLDKVDLLDKSPEYKSLVIMMSPVGGGDGQAGMDFHLADDCDVETVNTTVGGIHNALKQRGLVSSDMQRYLDKLRSSKIDYTRVVRKQVTMMVGDAKERSYKKPSRKTDEVILKGKTKEYGTGINLILDTSGSMYGELENVLSTVYRNDLYINFFQIDAEEVKSYDKVKSKKQIQNIAIKGGGGTELQPAVDAIKNHKDLKVRSCNTIILTDGYTDSLDLSGLNKVLLISTDRESPITHRSKFYKFISLANKYTHERD